MVVRTPPNTQNVKNRSSEHITLQVASGETKCAETVQVAMK